MIETLNRDCSFFGKYLLFLRFSPYYSLFADFVRHDTISMKAFVFDTETTGLPIRDADVDAQPHVIQFAGILAQIHDDGTHTEIERINELVKPPISIPFVASSVHGIYDRDVENELPVAEKITRWLWYLNASDTVAGHNLEFDELIIRSELARLGRDGEYQPMKRVCTMLSSTQHCQLAGRGFSYKPPKLNELYLHLFGERFSGAHDAMVDVEATLKCFVELVRRDVVQLQENPVMRLF